MTCGDRVDRLFDGAPRWTGATPCPAATGRCGRAGRSEHLALEVHDNDPRFGEGRWGRGARCRRRDMVVEELAVDD